MRFHLSDLETTLETKAEWLKNIKEMFDDCPFDVTKKDIKAKFITKDMGAIEITREEKCSWVQVLNVVL